MKAGRFLVRALVVAGGAAAVSAIAWLTGTASASTITETPDSPAVVTAIGHAVPVVRDAATPALTRVRDLSEAAADPIRLTETLETHVTHAVNALPGTVLAVRRIAEKATALTGLAAPPEEPSGHIGQSPAARDAAAPKDSAGEPVNGSPRHRPADLVPTTAPAHVATTAIAGQPHADDRSGHGADGLTGQSWLPSCVVPASAGFTSGHDRSGDDAVQPPAAEHAQSSHHGTGVLSRPVASAEIQPGVTPD